MSFDLPRFSSVEMKQARKMNKIAISQAKRPIVSNFSKASADDLQRLTSNTLEDSYKRVQWTNPKDGKVYHLLDNGRTEDGKAIVRILDADGAFVKEAVLKPKKIVMIDNSDLAFTNGEWVHNEIHNLTHLEQMKIFSKRNNPFSDLEILNTGKNGKEMTEKNTLAYFKELTQRINNGEKIDYITRSMGSPELGNRSQKALTGLEKRDSMANISLNKLLTECKKKNIRMFNSSSNSGVEALNRNLLADGIEGVGALDDFGKIAEFSSSRNSVYTQHYERGEIPVIVTKHGINITGLPGVDIAVKNSFIGKDNNRVTNIYNEIKRMAAAKKNEAEALRNVIDTEGAKVVGWQNIGSGRQYRYTSDLANATGQQERLKKLIRLEADNQVFANRAQKIYDSVVNKLVVDANGLFAIKQGHLGTAGGTSAATATRSAKTALNDMMEGFI